MPVLSLADTVHSVVPKRPGMVPLQKPAADQAEAAHRHEDNEDSIL